MGREVEKKWEKEREGETMIRTQCVKKFIYNKKDKKKNFKLIKNKIKVRELHVPGHKARGVPKSRYSEEQSN